MIYVDTSVIVSAITNENGTPQSQQWLSQHAAESLAFSGWVDTELASALAMKLRRGALDEDSRTIAEQQWRQMSASWRRIAIAERHFADGARFTSLGLRAGDALHLAIIAEQRLELVTGDDALAAVAASVGVKVYQP